MDLEICERQQNNDEISGEKSALNDDSRDKKSIEIIVKTEAEEKEEGRDNRNEDEFFSIQRNKMGGFQQQQEQINCLSPPSFADDFQVNQDKSTSDHLDPYQRAYLDRLSNVSYKSFINPIVEASARVMLNWENHNNLQKNNLSWSSKSSSSLLSQHKEQVLESKIQTEEILLDGKQKQINNQQCQISEVRSEKRQLKEDQNAYQKDQLCELIQGKDKIILKKDEESYEGQQNQKQQQYQQQQFPGVMQLPMEMRGFPFGPLNFLGGVNTNKHQENRQYLQTQNPYQYQSQDFKQLLSFPQKYPFNQAQQNDERFQTYFQQEQAFSLGNQAQNYHEKHHLAKQQQLMKKRSVCNLTESNSLAKIGRNLVMFLTDSRNLRLIQEITGDDFTEKDHDMFVDYCNSFRIRSKNDLVNLWEEQSIESDQYHLIIRVLSRIYLEKYCHCQILGTSKPYKVDVDLKIRRELLDMIKRI